MDKKSALLTQVIMTFIMALSMSGILGLIFKGPSMEGLSRWPKQFMIAWPLAFALTMVAWPTSMALSGAILRSRKGRSGAKRRDIRLRTGAAVPVTGGRSRQRLLPAWEKQGRRHRRP